MTKDRKIMTGRIAFRVEGSSWNAYYATPDTLEGAVFLGSIRMRLVENPKLKEQFMQLMRDALSEMMLELTGKPIASFSTRPAPESERSGNS